jgi:predicted phage-related endonuclease
MLNADQLAARAGKIGGSDIGKIASGNREEILKLWQEKIGERQPDDLDQVFQVFWGSRTEPHHLDWHERENRQAISRRGEVIAHYRYDWAICTLDGWIDELQCPIEVKCTGGHEPFDPIIKDRYTPQCQWQMEITGADHCLLSVVMCNSNPVSDFINRDAAYARKLIDVGALFMEHVRNRTPPVDIPVPPLPVDATRVVDMHGNNEFAHQADIWLQLRDSAAAYDDAAKILKSMVPPDAKRCFGYGVQITRNRLGNLSLREAKE